MKNVSLVLAVVLALTLNVEAATQKTTTTQSAFSKAKPPHHGYRMGTFHNRVPRYAVRIIQNGQIFYRYNGVYFRPYKRGFVVVNQPRYNYNYRQGQGYRNYPNQRYNHRYNNRGYRNGHGHGNRGGSGRDYKNGNRNGNSHGNRSGRGYENGNRDRNGQGNRGGSQGQGGNQGGGKKGSGNKKSNGNKGGRG